MRNRFSRRSNISRSFPTRSRTSLPLDSSAERFSRGTTASTAIAGSLYSRRPTFTTVVPMSKRRLDRLRSTRRMPRIPSGSCAAGRDRCNSNPPPISTDRSNHQRQRRFKRRRDPRTTNSQTNLASNLLTISVHDEQSLGIRASVK